MKMITKILRFKSAKMAVIMTLLLVLACSSWTFVSSFTMPMSSMDFHQLKRNCVQLKMAQQELTKEKEQTHFTWSPQDLTKETLDGYDNADTVKSVTSIPDDDYIKKFQANPQELWPVEFFIIAYRRCKNKSSNKVETQILVRESANGTSKYGLGTGVPVTRWVPSRTSPPTGYTRAEPNVSIDASCFPEFPKGSESWSYDKIHMMEDAFCQQIEDSEFQDEELEEYSKLVRDQLKKQVSEQRASSSSLSTWESIRLNLIHYIMENPNCPAAIQGTLRMSGLFQPKKEGNGCGERYISLASDDDDSTTLDPSTLAKSMRVYTMFPQMPDPMPLPSTSAQDLKEEIISRPMRMKESGRDPHQDKYGRKYTHISTSNVSNTIHGIYLPVDVTDVLPEGDDEDAPPALDLFGTKRVKRYWKSLQDLKVLDDNNGILTTEDPKPIFISGFIVRQLVKEGVIHIHG